MFKKTLALLLIGSIATPALALRDHWLDPDYQGTDISYSTGRLTRDDYNHDTFPAPRGAPLPRAEPHEYLLQPELLVNGNLTRGADTAFSKDGFSLGMMLIDHGHVIYERNEEGADTEYNGWSMSKSVTSLLVGEALCKGDIKSLDDTAGTYAPEIKDSTYGRATLRQLLSMTSGAPAPGDNPGGKQSGSSNGDHWEITRGMKGHVVFLNSRTQEADPQHPWVYDNLNIEAVELVLDHLKGTHTYMVELLKNAGVTNESHWLQDRDGHANAAYGYGATLEDWAKLAQYSLDVLKGRTNDKCMQKYMLAATTHVTQPQDVHIDHLFYFFGYGLGMWTHPYNYHGYAWMGNFGQKIFVDPKYETILVIFRHRNNAKFADFLGNQFWHNWRMAHEPRPEDRESGNVIRSKVNVDFVEAPKK